MHNFTPLGATMHLKELDRQATPKLRPLRSTRQDAPAARLIDLHMATTTDEVGGQSRREPLLHEALQSRTSEGMG